MLEKIPVHNLCLVRVTWSLSVSSANWERSGVTCLQATYRLQADSEGNRNLKQCALVNLAGYFGINVQDEWWESEAQSVVRVSGQFLTTLNQLTHSIHVSSFFKTPLIALTHLSQLNTSSNCPPRYKTFCWFHKHSRQDVPNSSLKWNRPHFKYCCSSATNWSAIPPYPTVYKKYV